MVSAPTALVTDQDVLLDNPYEVANEFNKYFVSVFTSEDKSNIPLPSQKYFPVPGEQEELTDLHFTEVHVFKKLKSLKTDKVQGPDNISAKLLATTADLLARPVYMIFKKSLQEGVLPVDWKAANVSPIHKSGSKTSPSNYRPISLTSHVCKVMESLFRDEIVQHLESNGLINDSQHGFRKGRSCLTNLLTFLDKVSGYVDTGTDVDVIFLDFAKAFDKVPHQRLIGKVQNHGIDGKVLNWISNWLSGRVQRVQVKGVSSTWEMVTSGVPQGSGLGPILFLIYINDMDDEIMNQLLKSADDTKIFSIIRTDEEADNLQKDLDTLLNWTNDWQMQFNVKKCKVMHLGKQKQNHQYHINGNQLESVKTEKDLGVTLSADLKVAQQCSNACSKANRMAGLIKRTIENKDKMIMLRLYKTLVRPHVEYSISAWSPHYIKDKNQIEKVQRRFTKMIPELHGLTYGNRLKALKLWTLEERRNRADLIEVFKLFRGISTLPLENFFQLDMDKRTRGHSAKLKKSRCNTELRRHFFSERVVNRWNSLKQATVEAAEVNSFKRLLDRERLTRIDLFMD